MASDPTTRQLQGISAHIQILAVWWAEAPYSTIVRLHSTRNFRSAEIKDLVIPQIKLVIASRAFSVAAPHIWNSLPLDVSSAFIPQETNDISVSNGLQTLDSTLFFPHLQFDICMLTYWRVL